MDRRGQSQDEGYKDAKRFEQNVAGGKQETKKRGYRFYSSFFFYFTSLSVQDREKNDAGAGNKHRKYRKHGQHGQQRYICNSLAPSAQPVQLPLQGLVFSPQAFILPYCHLQLSLQRRVGQAMFLSVQGTAIVTTRRRECRPAFGHRLGAATGITSLQSKSRKQVRQNDALLLILPVECVQMAQYRLSAQDLQ